MTPSFGILNCLFSFWLLHIFILSFLSFPSVLSHSPSVFRSFVLSNDMHRTLFYCAIKMRDFFRHAFMKTLTKHFVLIYSCTKTSDGKSPTGETPSRSNGHNHLRIGQQQSCFALGLASWKRPSYPTSWK